MIESNSIIFAGPFLGEFGWELSHWMPHVRWLRKQYRGKKLVVSSYPGRQALYNEIVDEFIPLPEWFIKDNHDCDGFEALGEDGPYNKIIQYFNGFLEEKYKNKNVLWTKTPRGFNRVIRESGNCIFEPIIPTSEGNKIADDLIEKYGNKPIIIIFARSMKRRMFLDINLLRCAYIEDWYPDGLPTRNYPRSNWEELFGMLYSRFNKDFTFAIGGTKEGNCLLETAQKTSDVIDLTEVASSVSLDVTIALLDKAFMSISSQSGPTHLSLQCGCPSFIYGHEMERHTQIDNPLGTDVVFYPTQLGNYNDPPESLFGEISVYINQLKSESQKPISNISPRSDISRGAKRIGIVGVFNNPNSTNIPFAKALKMDGKNQVNIFDYREVESQIGCIAMNQEIKKFCKDFDLIIFCKGSSICPRTIAHCSSITKTCWYMMDAKIHLDNNPAYYDMAKAATFNIVTTGKVASALKEKNINHTYHIFQGIDPEQFKPIDLEKINDVLFVGQATQKRNEIIESIIKAGIEVFCYGMGYGDELYGDSFNRACSSTKILLAINNTDPSEDSFSDRILRYLATKGCVVTEYSEGLEKYFRNGEHIAWPIEGISFSDLIKTYLDHPKMREQMAERGYQHVLENYTWDNVAKKIVQIVEGN